MAYEFKKLSDVEVVEAPANNANILIEENGVIKKTAIDNIDLLMGVVVGNTTDCEVTIDNYSVLSGSVEAVFEKIRAGLPPIVKIRYQRDDLNNYQAFVREIPVSVELYNEWLWLSYLYHGHMTNTITLCELSINNDGSFDYFNSQEVTMA